MNNLNLMFINFKLLSDKIGLLQLKNIAKKNSLNSKMLEEVLHLINSIKNERIKAIILESLCPKVFSSGHDLEEFYKNFKISEEENNKVIDLCNKTMLSIHNSDKIFISEISSQLVTAAGLQLASTCDLMVASSDSLFSIPGSRIGLYAATPAIPLIHSLPKKVLFEMLFTAKSFTAEEMFKFGLVNELVEINLNDNMEKIELKVRDKSLKLCDKISLLDLDEIKKLKMSMYNL